jgi:hypothetical protein
MKVLRRRTASAATKYLSDDQNLLTVWMNSDHTIYIGDIYDGFQRNIRQKSCKEIQIIFEEWWW